MAEQTHQFDAVFEDIDLSVNLLGFLPGGDLHRFACSSRVCCSSAHASYKARLDSASAFSPSAQVLMNEGAISYNRQHWAEEQHLFFEEIADARWILRKPNNKKFRWHKKVEADPGVAFFWTDENVDQTGRDLATDMSLPKHLSGADVLHCSLVNKILLVLLIKTVREGSDNESEEGSSMDSGAAIDTWKEVWGVVYHQNDLGSGRPTIVQKLPSLPVGREFHGGDIKRSANGRAMAMEEFEYVKDLFYPCDENPGALNQVYISLFAISTPPDGGGALVKRHSIQVPSDGHKNCRVDIDLSVGGEMACIRWYKNGSNAPRHVIIYDVQRVSPEMLLKLESCDSVLDTFFTLDNEFVLELRLENAQAKRYIDETRFPAFA